MQTAHHRAAGGIVFLHDGGAAGQFTVFRLDLFIGAEGVQYEVCALFQLEGQFRVLGHRLRKQQLTVLVLGGEGQGLTQLAVGVDAQFDGGGGFIPQLQLAEGGAVAEG